MLSVAVTSVRFPLRSSNKTSALVGSSISDGKSIGFVLNVLFLSPVSEEETATSGFTGSTNSSFFWS